MGKIHGIISKNIDQCSLRQALASLSIGSLVLSKSASACF